MSQRILFVCDDNYVYPLAVALGSVRYASQEVFEIVMINIPNWNPENPLIQQTNINLLKSVCDSLNLRLTIINIKVDDINLLGSRPSYGHITGTAWAKIIAFFFIDGMRFPEILYLDPDTLMLSGFEEVFRLSSASATGIAARATTGHDSFEKVWRSKYESETGNEISKKTGWYFNSGVMKVDLQKFQNFEHWIKWQDLFENNQQHGLILQDQDLLNALTVGCVDKLEVSYNCYPSEYSIFDTKIIHFAGGYKPWQFRNPISRIRMNKNARAAMKLWRNAEKITLNHFSKSLHQSDFQELLAHRKSINKGLAFAMAKLFPKLANRKQVGIMLKHFRQLK